jgi:hypothetical protein
MQVMPYRLFMPYYILISVLNLISGNVVTRGFIHEEYSPQQERYFRVYMKGNE